MHLLCWLADCKEHIGLFHAHFHVLEACDQRHIWKPEGLSPAEQSLLQLWPLSDT